MFDPFPSRSRSNSTPLPAFIRRRRATAAAGTTATAVAEMTTAVPPRPQRNPARSSLRPLTSSGISDDHVLAWDASRSTHTSSVLLAPDTSLLRRNKSTGSKFARPRTSNSFSTPAIENEHLHLNTRTVTAQFSALQSTRFPPPSSWPSNTSHPVPRPDTQKPKSLVVPSAPPSPKQSHTTSLTQKQKHPQFSTADRTILEELKRSISARDAQFARKSVTRARHHPYSSYEVPYPRSYARDVVDLDVWETAIWQQICGGLTFHHLDYPPTKVLDIGCGTGTWILNCARSWRNCHFVGLDIVPLHPDLQRVGSSDLASRITWVQANFLDGLPFPNEEFDFVHVKRISRGVPEDKWDSFFKEVTRVMKFGAAFEMIEEDLFFPTAHQHRDGNTVPQEDTESGRNLDRRSISDSSDSPPTPPATILLEVPRSISPIGNSSRVAPVHPHGNGDNNGQGSESDALRDNVIQVSQPNLAPHMRRSQEVRPRLVRAKSASAAVSPLSTSLSYIRPSTSHIAQGNSLRPLIADSKTVSVSALSLPISDTLGPHLAPGSQSGSVPLLRTLPCVPPNPSDHTLLERIYTEMHAARFINLAPLSLLANSLAMHFKDVRTHPPLQVVFPPRPLEQILPISQRVSMEMDGWDSGSDSDEASEAVRPLRQHSHTALSTVLSDRTQFKQSTTIPDNPTLRTLWGREGLESLHSLQDGVRWVSVQDLSDGAAPYLPVDDARMSAYSPSTRLPFPSSVYSTFSTSVSGSDLSVIRPTIQGDSSVGGDDIHGPRESGARDNLAQRPLKPTANFDLRTLNLHLALRTTEVLACAEAMWEWVLDNKQKRRKQDLVHVRGRAGSVEGVGERAPGSVLFGGAFGPPEDDVMKAIIELNRADFDCLLSKFDQDMRQHMSVGMVLQSEYGWTNVRLPPTTDDKAFGDAYGVWEEWEQWERQQRHGQDTAHYYHHRSSRLSTHAGFPRSVLTERESGSTSESRRSSVTKRTLRREVRPPLREVSQPLSADGSSQQQQQSQQPLSRSLRIFAAWKA